MVARAYRDMASGLPWVVPSSEDRSWLSAKSSVGSIGVDEEVGKGWAELHVTECLLSELKEFVVSTSILHQCPHRKQPHSQSKIMG